MARPPAKKGASRRKAAATAKRKRQAAQKAPPRKKSPAPQKAARKAAPKQKQKQSGLSAYQRRIARYLDKHPGATVQQARGHKAREHVTRAERERERVEAFASRQAWRGERYGAPDAETMEEKLWQYIRDKGFGWFGKLERAVNALHARYVQQGSAGLGMGVEGLADLADDLGLDPEDWAFLFYH